MSLKNYVCFSQGEVVFSPSPPPPPPMSYRFFLCCIEDVKLSYLTSNTNDGLIIPNIEIKGQYFLQ